ncbi:hypothetical protein [Clostridium sp.]|uniref:hypothetical protein n=1 Tax=Clostridium sp. TaxID=1506 RepID=UPI003FD8C24A
MIKEEFTKLNILDQVKFINSKTKTGLNISEVAQEINISESAIRRIMKKNNYKFNRIDKVYLLSSNNIEIIKETPKINKAAIPKKEINNNNFTNEMAKGLKELLEVKEALLHLIGITENNKGINILEVINMDRSNRKKATFNMDITLLEKLKIYDNDLNTSKSDIVNIALKEYLNNKGIIKE